MPNVPSLVEWEHLIRAEKWAPWREGWAESGASIPPAAKASVARFEAIKAKVDAYERSHRRQPGGDDFLAEVRLGHSS